MNNRNFISVTFLMMFVVNFNYGQSEIHDLEFLIGTWKTEDKDSFEVWKKDNNGDLIGNSYKLNQNKKIILETLSITKIEDKIIYAATVFDQNQGETILFILNHSIKYKFSFENFKHDFPKKIQYKKLKNTEIQVSVLGDNDKGFSYKIIKQ